MKKTRTEEIREYYLSRLNEIRDEKLGYDYDYNHGLLVGSSIGDDAFNIKLSLFRQGKFTFKTIDNNKLQNITSFSDIVDTVITFKQEDMETEYKRITDERNKEIEAERVRVALIINEYNDLKDRFMFNRLTTEEMYFALQRFISINNIENTKVACPC